MLRVYKSLLLQCIASRYNTYVPTTRLRAVPYSYSLCYNVAPSPMLVPSQEDDVISVENGIILHHQPPPADDGSDAVLYGINDKPPWHLSALLGRTGEKIYRTRILSLSLCYLCSRKRSRDVLV